MAKKKLWVDGQDARVVLGDSKRQKSVLLLTLDKYDSDFFRKRIGRISYCGGRIPVKKYSQALQHILAEARRRRYEYLFYKIPGSCAFLRAASQENGFVSCGVNVDFCLDLKQKCKKREITKDPYKIRIATKSDENNTARIARDAFRHSRLYKMGFVEQKKVDDYHGKWAVNLMRDKKGIVFVGERDGKIRGFLAINLSAGERSGRIMLIAVDKNERGKGLGGILLDNAVDWARRKMDIIYAMTQQDNAPAISFYKSHGFKVADHEYGYHKILDS